MFNVLDEPMFARAHAAHERGALLVGQRALGQASRPPTLPVLRSSRTGVSPAL